MDKNVAEIAKNLDKAGFEVAIVGGAVRDILAKKEVSDWDLTTNAKPEEILKLFPKGFYNNQFGTVGIPVEKGTPLHKLTGQAEGQRDKELEIVEVTTYRTEESYSDSRHPDKVSWGKTLEEDLARRDFTINAMGLVRGTKGQRDKVGKYIEVGGQKWRLIDPYGGQEDLKNKIIRTVGNADERFNEDALRLLRAIRLSTTLEFTIEANTQKAIKKHAASISKISGERTRIEIFKIIESVNNAEGIFLARELGVLKYILPELDECFVVEQKSPQRHHIYDVGTHNVMSMKFCPSKKTIVKFATMLHDVGKARVADVTAEGVRTFYNHEVVGAHQTLDISRRLNLSKTEREKVFLLVRWHQFSVSEDQTDKAVRRFIKNVGLENVEDMMDLRIGDRLGGGLQQPESWRLKLYRTRIKEVLTKPFTVADLKINGRDVMKVLDLTPGPKVGEVLNKLFEEVADDKAKNSQQFLLKRLKSFQARKGH